jgi:hypothetical protein
LYEFNTLTRIQKYFGGIFGGNMPVGIWIISFISKFYLAYVSLALAPQNYADICKETREAWSNAGFFIFGCLMRRTGRSINGRTLYQAFVDGIPLENEPEGETEEAA